MKGVIDSGTKVAAASGIVIAGGMFVLADPIAANIFGKPELANVLKIMILALPFIALMHIFLSALKGAKLIKYNILVEQVVRPTLRFILIVAAFEIGWRLRGVVWAWVIASFYRIFVAGYFLMREVRKLDEEKSRMRMKDLFTFSLPVWIHRMLCEIQQKYWHFVDWGISYRRSSRDLQRGPAYNAFIVDTVYGIQHHLFSDHFGSVRQE